MLNRCKRLFIIVTGQLLLPVLLVFIIAPILLRGNTDFTLIQSIISKFQNFISILHLVFYLGLIWFWPRLINYMVSSRENISEQQLQIALNSKWYLLGIFIFFELLVVWR